MPHTPVLSHPLPRPTSPLAQPLGRMLLASTMIATALLVGCANMGPVAATAPLPCDDGLKTAFQADALTTVVAVLPYKKGDKVFVSDSGAPVTLAADMCMVKLKVGPGNPGPADARSTSLGIGIEVWLPTRAQWNQRIRNYGGGGYLGGGVFGACLAQLE